MTIEEKIEGAKKFVPEIKDFDIEIVKRLYEIVEKKHPEEKEDMLRAYLLGYLLTLGIDVNFTEVQISNIVLKETNSENSYLIMYKKLLELTGYDPNMPTVGII